MTSPTSEEPAVSAGVQIQAAAGELALRRRQPVIGEPGVETAIMLQVTAALVAHPPTEFTVIEVNNTQGVITLKGQVGSTQLQAMVGEIASRYPGVEATVNALEIYAQADPDPEVMM